MSSNTTAAALPVEQDERKKRAAWRPLAAAAIAGSVLVTTGFGVWASLQASATNTTPQSLSTGTLKLELADNGDGFKQVVQKLAPNDVVNRYVTVTNSGTLEGKDLTLAAAATGTNAVLTGTSAMALQVTVSSCSVAWNPTAGTCSGTTTDVLPKTALGSLTATKLTGLAKLDPTTGYHFRVSVAVPDHVEHTVNGVLPTSTVQGASTSITWTFNETQRAGTTFTS